MPHRQKTKTENRNNIVTNSIKTSKMVHFKKKKILKKESREEVRGKALFKQRPKGEGHGSGETLWGDGLTCKGSGV